MQKRIYPFTIHYNMMFYHFELQMAGVILLTAMTAGGISLWIKRRRDRIKEELSKNDATQEFPSDNS